MEPMIVGLIGLVLMLVLLSLGTPVGFSMAAIGFLGICYFIPLNTAFVRMATIPYEIISSYSFCVLPLFFFMANLCLQARLSEDLFKMVYLWMGRLPGGLAVAAIGAATIFGAVCASALATILTIGLVALPEMKKYKYESGLAAACVASGGVLGILIPPSGVLIIYALLTEQSIGALFIAGIIPGIVLCLMFMVMIVTRCIINPKLGPRGPVFPFKEKVKSFGGTIEIILLIVLVIGGLLVGWFTPTEAGAVGSFGAIVFALLRRRLKWQGFKDAVWETAMGSGMIYTIVIGAFVFSNFLALSTLPSRAAEMIAGLGLSDVAVTVMIIILYLILGCFLDATPMMLLSIPVIYPIVVSIGYDPIWFGIFIVVMCGIGNITPPVGMGVYVIAGIAKDVPMGTIFRGAVPFLIVMIIFTALLAAVPQIATFLPGLMY